MAKDRARSPARGPVALAAAGALALATAGLLFALRSERLPLAELRGDEPTFVAMTESLALDRDLLFAAPDAARAPSSLILERTARGFAYSKPVLYPLFAAPFVALFGRDGMVVANGVALLATLLFGWAYLRRLGDRGGAALVLVTFAGASVVVPYVVWRMSESLQIALATSGLVLALARFRFSATADGRGSGVLDGRFAPEAGAALLGLLASLREPNGLLALVPVAAFAAAGEKRRAFRLLAVAAVGYLAVAGLTRELTGAVNPYKAPRATFNAETGFPAASDSGDRWKEHLERHGATSSLAVAPPLEPTTSLYAALYALVGRHAGFLVYFPASLALGATVARRRDRVSRIALAGFAAVALFYLVWMPHNFFGGETFLGNRYLLAAYPCLLVALVELPAARAIAASWLVAAAVGGSALVSVDRTRERDATSQNHTYAGLFRLLPYESTAPLIDGRHDRYWSGDFVRFVDPYAEVGQWSFRLAPGEPAAELELALAWSGEPIRFLAKADRPGTALRVGEGFVQKRFQMDPAGSTLVEFTPEAAWRRHPFWWDPRYRVRVHLVRLGVESPAGSSGGVELRYLGRGLPPRVGFGREVLSARLPDSLAAGGSTEVALRLKNTGSWAWTSDSTLPVMVGWRFEPADGGAPISEGRCPLPSRVEPGQTIDAGVRFDAPKPPGRYRLVVDLVVEDVTWFAEKLGAPISTAELEVRPAP